MRAHVYTHRAAVRFNSFNRIFWKPANQMFQKSMILRGTWNDLTLESCLKVTWRSSSSEWNYLYFIFQTTIFKYFFIQNFLRYFKFCHDIFNDFPCLLRVRVLEYIHETRSFPLFSTPSSLFSSLLLLPALPSFELNLELLWAERIWVSWA